MESRFSLKNIWTALILFAVIIPVSIVMAWYGQQLYKSHLTSALATERNANEFLSKQIESELRRFETLLKNKADPLSLLIDNLEIPYAKSDIYTLLDFVVTREKAIREIILLSNTSEMIAAIDPSIGISKDNMLTQEQKKIVIKSWGLNSAYELPEIIIPSSGRTYIGSPKPHDDFFAFKISVPIGNPVKAILIAMLDVNQLWPKKLEENHSEEITTLNYLLDRRGSLISSIKGSKYNPGDLMTHLPITRTALINEEWPTNKSYIGVINQPAFGTLMSVPPLNWTLVSEVPADQITDPIWDSLLNIALFTLFGLVLFIILILKLVNKTLLPIKQAYEAIDHVAKGDYQYTLELSGIRELDVMSSGFNNMANEILKREKTINTIAVGVSGQTGNTFFQKMVNELSQLFDTKYTFIGLLDEEDPLLVNTLAVSIDANSADNISYNLKDTPCENVVQQETCAYPKHIQQHFPNDILLQEMQAEGYIGAPIFSAKKDPIGLIVALDTKPLLNLSQVKPILEIFAARIGAELERLNSEEALRESEARFRQLTENINEVFWLGSVDWNQILYISPAYEKNWGQSSDALYADARSWINAVLPEDREQVIADIPQGETEIDDYFEFREYRIQKPDGEIRWIKARAYPIRDKTGKITRIAGIAEDITEYKHQEELLRRSKKMDALGKLTGGIAHDYNNMLGVILGYAELLNDKLSDQPKLAKYVKEIQNAGERNKTLTKRLLSFSKHKIIDAKSININTILQSQHQMLEKTLTARIKLTYDLEDNLSDVYLDSGDLEDALVNMSINAMHAIDGNGKISIETNNIQIDSTDARLLQLEPGEYVSLSITDNGLGMGKEMKEKIFDPFFTTKGEMGTGLGLSQVYGFVERSHGSIKVYSEPGYGTQFILYFPKYKIPKTNTEKYETKDLTNKLQGKEKILIVDDEKSLRVLASEILGQKGYTVICAESGEQALEILENETFDLMISDVVMPEMDGHRLAAIVREKYPSIKIQLASGFSDERENDQINQSLRKNMLHKPYKSTALLENIRNLFAE